MTDEPRPEDAAPDNTATATEGTAEEAKPKKLEQTIEMRDVGPCKKHVKVTVDRKAIDERLKEKFSDLVHNATVPGFRPGKAPAKLVQRRYKSEVGEQVKTEVLLSSLEQLADETDLAPLSAPNIDPEKIEMPTDGPFVYEFEVEVRPQFDLPEYKGLKLKKPVYTFTDQDVEKEVRRLLLPEGQVVPKPEGNAQEGDVIVADLVFKNGDQRISEAKEVSLRVEKQLVLRDALARNFGEKITGANPGDKRAVDIELSTQSANPALRGKTVTMEVDVKDVKTIRLPELNEQYLEQFGVSNEAQLRELIKVALEKRLEFQQRQSARQQVVQQIAATKTWDLPRDLLLRQARKALNRKAMEMQADGLQEQEIEARLRMMQQDVLRTAELGLVEHFVLQKIAETEKIEVNDDDMENEIERIAAQQGESPRRIRARLEKDDMLDALAAEMIERRALDVILDSATYEDVPLGGEEVQESVAAVAQQAVPGEMRDLEAEAAESVKTAQAEEAPATEQS